MVKLKPGPKGPHKHPLLLRVPVNTKLPQWLASELRKQDNQSATIETALMRFLNLKTPKVD